MNIAELEPQSLIIRKKIDKLLVDRWSAEKPRPYLGGSQIGEECQRQLVQSFRWMHRNNPGARALSRAETGHVWEDRMVERLRAVGFEVIVTYEDLEKFTGKRIENSSMLEGQLEVSAHHDHFAGHLDGLVWDVEAKELMLLECKAMASAKYVWEDDTYQQAKENKTADRKYAIEGRWFVTKRRGVKAAQPVYWWQVQTYLMLLEQFAEAWNLPMVPKRCMFMMMNTDLDQLHIEFIDAQPSVFEGIMSKAREVIAARSLPPRIDQLSGGYGPCRFCDFRLLCHAGYKPAVNCRSCKHGLPGREGQWICKHPQRPTTTQKERRAMGFEPCADWEEMKEKEQDE